MLGVLLLRVNAHASSLTKRAITRFDRPCSWPSRRRHPGDQCGRRERPSESAGERGANRQRLRTVSSAILVSASNPVQPQFSESTESLPVSVHCSNYSSRGILIHPVEG